MAPLTINSHLGNYLTVNFKSKWVSAHTMNNCFSSGHIDAAKILSHTMKLDEAPKAYEMFEK